MSNRHTKILINTKYIFVLLIYSTIHSCTIPTEDRYIIFLHGRHLETHDLIELHTEYGRMEYNEILSAFNKRGLKVLSQKRSSNVNTRDYALKIISQVDSLMLEGIPPQNITIAGASKGGYIAQYISTFSNNPDLNLVFIASFRKEDIHNLEDINYCGKILTIYENSDLFGVSAIQRKINSTCKIEQFKEIELTTGLKHGFLIKALDEWIEPTSQWAKGNFKID